MTRKPQEKQEGRRLDRLFGAACISIPSSSLLSFKTEECHVRIVRMIEGLHHGLATRSDPAPIADHRSTTEQCRLDRNPVEAPHVLRLIDTVKMNLACLLVFHVPIVAVPAGSVQRVI